MKIGVVIDKMVRFYEGSQHDINHFLKVYAYAKTIGEQEGLSEAVQEQLEVAAIVHDIACPLCREKYGNTNGKYQEQEGAILARKFLEELSYPQEPINRVCYLVGHHHTYSNIDGVDYQILLEADYLVNAEESNLSAENIKNTLDKMFRTNSGKSLLRSIYKIPDMT
jgi:HD superfamily phosphodiesterase